MLQEKRSLGDFSKNKRAGRCRFPPRLPSLDKQTREPVQHTHCPPSLLTAHPTSAVFRDPALSSTPTAGVFQSHSIPLSQQTSTNLANTVCPSLHSPADLPPLLHPQQESIQSGATGMAVCKHPQQELAPLKVTLTLGEGKITIHTDLTVVPAHQQKLLRRRHRESGLLYCVTVALADAWL